MGLLIEYFKNKSKIYWLSIIFDIILALAFIYLSFQVREYYLKCNCPTIPIIKEVNISVKP
jgi:hypothetical protein